MSMRQLSRIAATNCSPKTLGLGCRGLAVLLLCCVLWQLSPVLIELGHVLSDGCKSARLVAARGNADSYFTAGLWRADARTLAAIMHYLWEAEPRVAVGQIAMQPPPGGLPVVWSPPAKTASQTNSPAPI